MSTERGSAYHAGITPEIIVDAATALTAQHGLDGWSIRDLARALSVTPSVIYHHVGGTDLLSKNVVERVTQLLPLPDPALEWREWMRAMLFPARSILRGYPGVAKWFLMHGPTFASALPIIDDGVAVLQRAGFAERTALVYSALFNTAMLTISLYDDRLKHEADGPRDHHTMMRELDGLRERSPGVDLISRDLVLPLATVRLGDPDPGAEYYRQVLEALMAGFKQCVPDSSPAQTDCPSRKSEGASGYCRGD